MSRPRGIPRRVYRQVCLHLVERVEKSFPQDWAPGITFQEVVRRWLFAESNRK